jgi:hypothetical protein
VSVALAIQYAMRMYHVICGLFRPYDIFPHYLISTKILEKGIEHKMCIFIFSTTSVWKIFHF